MRCSKRNLECVASDARPACQHCHLARSRCDPYGHRYYKNAPPLNTGDPYDETPEPESGSFIHHLPFPSPFYFYSCYNLTCGRHDRLRVRPAMGAPKRRFIRVPRPRIPTERDLDLPTSSSETADDDTWAYAHTRARDDHERGIVQSFGKLDTRRAQYR